MIKWYGLQAGHCCLVIDFDWISFYGNDATNTETTQFLREFVFVIEKLMTQCECVTDKTFPYNLTAWRTFYLVAIDNVDITAQDKMLHLSKYNMHNSLIWANDDLTLAIRSQWAHEQAKGKYFFVRKPPYRFHIENELREHLDAERL